MLLAANLAHRGCKILSQNAVSLRFGSEIYLYIYIYIYIFKKTGNPKTRTSKHLTFFATMLIQIAGYKRMD